MNKKKVTVTFLSNNEEIVTVTFLLRLTEMVTVTFFLKFLLNYYFFLIICYIIRS